MSEIFEKIDRENQLTQMEWQYRFKEY